MNKTNTCIILAGGRGTRLGKLVDQTPKPMLNIAGKPFLEHILNYWKNQGISRFILSIGFQGQVIKEYFGNHFNDVEIEYAQESTPLGTGGALLHALKQTNEEFVLVLNGDSYFKTSLVELEKFHQEHDRDISICLFRNSSQLRFGQVVLNRKNRIESFNSTPTSLPYLANAGMYLVRKSLLQQLFDHDSRNCSFEEDILPNLIAQKKVWGIEFDCPFIDIGIPKDLEIARNCFFKEDSVNDQ